MLINVFCKLIAVGYVVHVLLKSHNVFIFFITYKHKTTGRFHLKMYIFSLGGKKEQLAMLSPYSLQMEHVLPGLSVSMWTSFLLYVTFLTPIKIFIVIPDIQKKLSVGERTETIKYINPPSPPRLLPQYTLIKTWCQ